MLSFLFWSAAFVFGVIMFVGCLGSLISMLPECVQILLDFGCGCLVILFGFLIIVVPVLFLIFWLIGTFCD